jgi:hypothetical protein
MGSLGRSIDPLTAFLTTPPSLPPSLLPLAPFVIYRYIVIAGMATTQALPRLLLRRLLPMDMDMDMDMRMHHRHHSMPPTRHPPTLRASGDHPHIVHPMMHKRKRKREGTVIHLGPCRASGRSTVRTRALYPGHRTPRQPVSLLILPIRWSTPAHLMASLISARSAQLVLCLHL